MLNKSGIALSRDHRNMPILVCADASNTASIRGLEKAGFARLGTYDVTSGALSLYTSHRTIEENATIQDVWSAAQRLAHRPALAIVR